MLFLCFFNEITFVNSNANATSLNEFVGLERSSNVGSDAWNLDRDTRGGET